MTPDEQKQRRTRLVDVAKAAGVSRGTAGNVFSRPELVRAEVRVRVEEAARVLGYAGPDPRGRLLRAGRTNAVGVVTADRLDHFFDDPYMREFMRGASAVCDEHHASISLISGYTLEAGALGVKRALVDGLILRCLDETVRLVELARSRSLPLVVIDFDIEPEVSSVRIDDRGGAKAAAEHLLQLGHRKFGILSLMVVHDGRTGPVDRARYLSWSDSITRERVLGYEQALASAGISIDDVPIVESTTDAETGAKMAAILLERAPEVTAILAMSDVLALGALKAAEDRGLSVPRDLSIVGFDDIAAAAVASRPLTTVRQPISEKGRVAARLIFDQGPPRQIVLPVELVIRQSTAPPSR